MFPAQPEQFSKDLDLLRFPDKYPDEIRRPINWIIPLKKFEKDENGNTPKEEEFAVKQAYNCMMSQIKLLQKLHSDRGLSKNYKKFSDEEEEIWIVEELKICKGIVENFSVIEVVKQFPKYTKVREDGKVSFDIEAFKGMVSHNPEKKEGDNFVDEYELCKIHHDKIEKDKIQKEALLKNKEEIELINKEALKNETSKIDILKDAVLIEPKEEFKEEWLNKK